MSINAQFDWQCQPKAENLLIKILQDCGAKNGARALIVDRRSSAELLSPLLRGDRERGIAVGGGNDFVTMLAALQDVDFIILKEKGQTSLDIAINPTETVDLTRSFVALR